MSSIFVFEFVKLLTCIIIAPNVKYENGHLYKNRVYFLVESTVLI